MEHTLSPGARAALAVIEDRRQIQDSKLRLRAVLEHNAEYLSSNSILVFVGEEKPSEALLEAERNGNPEASLQRSRGWIQNGWLRAGQSIQDLGLTEVVQHLAVPQVSWMDMHDLFVALIVSGKQGPESERIARKLSAIRMELGTGRYVLGRYFGWLKDQLDEYWKAHDAGLAHPEHNLTGGSGALVSNRRPNTLKEFARERRLTAPFIRGPDWISARDLARSTSVGAPALANARCLGRKTTDGLAGVDARDRMWVKPSKNAHVLYWRESVSKPG